MELTKARAASRRFEMRRAILAFLTASGLAGLGALPAEAVGTRYPFCITGPEQPGLSNCTFTSYEQCQATASGRQSMVPRKSRITSARATPAHRPRPTVPFPAALCRRRPAPPDTESRARANASRPAYDTWALAGHGAPARANCLLIRGRLLNQVRAEDYSCGARCWR